MDEKSGGFTLVELIIVIAILAIRMYSAILVENDICDVHVDDEEPSEEDFYPFSIITRNVSMVKGPKLQDVAQEM